MIAGAYYYASDSNYMKGHYLGLTDHRYTIETKPDSRKSVNHIVTELSKSYVRQPIFLTQFGTYESFSDVEYTIDPSVKCLTDIKLKTHQGIIDERLGTTAKQTVPFNLKPVGPIVRIWPDAALIPLKRYRFRMDGCSDMCFYGVRRHSHQELIIIHDEPLPVLHRTYTYIELIDTDTISIKNSNQIVIKTIQEYMYTIDGLFPEFDWFVGGQTSVGMGFIGTDADNNRAYITWLC